MRNLNGLLTALLFPVIVFAQSSAVKKAEKAYMNYDYKKVIETIGQKKDLEPAVLRELAVSYKMTGDYVNAEYTYTRILTSPKKTTEDLFAYTQILKMNKKYVEASTQLELYRALVPHDSRLAARDPEEDYLLGLAKDNGRFVIKNLEINSAEQDFGAIYYKERIAYTSSNRKLGSVYRSWNGNHLPYLDLYSAKMDSSGELSDPVNIGRLNKKYHEGPAAYSADGRFTIFTTDNYISKSKDNVRNLQLYESTLDKNDEWSKPVPFQYNNEDYSCGHPALSADGNTLFFASDKPGGKGGVDIYRSTRNAEGKWSEPENMGEKINTEGNEVFPFFHESGLLFFSSDGHPGLGGLDVFAARMKNGTVDKIINVGAPVNSSKDDFTFILNGEQSKGYFASNREGGKGDDDIYSFKLLKPLVFDKTVEGTAEDKNGTALANRVIRLHDEFGNVVDSVITDARGHYVFKNLPAENTYITELAETDVALKTVDGIAKDKNGTVLANRVIRLYDESGKIVGIVVTDSKGRYLFRNLPAEKAYLAEMDEADTGFTTSEGVAKDKRGNILPNRVIRRYDTLGNVVDSVITNAKGRYVFRNIPAERSGIIEIPDADIVLKTVEGIAKDKHGNIMANRVIRLYDESGEIAGIVVTDAKGHYIFKNLPVEKAYIAGLDDADVALNPKEGIAKDKRGNILANRVIYVYDSLGNSVDSVITDTKGHYRFKNLQGERSGISEVPETDVALRSASSRDTSNDWMQVERKTITAMEEPDVMMNDSSITPAAKPVVAKAKKPAKPVKPMPAKETQDPLARLESLSTTTTESYDTITLHSIHFDLDKYDLRYDAPPELNRIAAILNRHPGMEMELDAHADCRGSEAYNMILSKKRAAAALEYIRPKITKPARIHGKGFGELMLLNTCACEGSVESSCTEEEHARNRRVDFKIISAGDQLDF